MRFRPLFYLGLVGLVALATALLNWKPNQVASATVLSSLLLGSLFFWRLRVAFAMLGVATLLALRLLDIPHLVEFAGLDIILFLIGTMLLIGFLDERQFFERMVGSLTRYAGSGLSLTILLMLLAGVFSALVGEVASILFMAAIVFRITDRYRQTPVPFLLMVIFTTNVGSAATVVGNPVGVLIALRAGLTFTDFLRWASPIAGLAIIMSVAFFIRYYWPQIRGLDKEMKANPALKGTGGPSLFGRDMWLPWALFVGTITALVIHSRLEKLLHLEKNTMLLGVALLAGGVVLLLERERARELVEKRVEWGTLSFFLLLFASVGTLKLTGITQILAQGLASFSGDREVLTFLGITWISGALSSILDNVLAVATFIPVVQDLGAGGVNTFPLWWGLLFGGTLFGNLTLIGSTANIVALGLLEKRGEHIGLGYWLKATIIPVIATMALASLLLYLQLLR